MSRSPLYERVESVLAGDIADGSLPPGTQLPSEDGLVERFKVSRTTVRKAIQNLVEHGLVEVRRGKGTFVTQPTITQELTELTGFVEDMQAAGRTPTARLLDKRIVAADEARNVNEEELQMLLNCYQRSRDNGGYVATMEKLVVS